MRPKGTRRRPARSWTLKEIHRAAAMRSLGMTYAAVASALGRDAETVRLHLVSRGLAPKTKECRPIDQSAIKALHAGGKTDAEIALAMGRRQDSVRRVRRRMGLAANRVDPSERGRRAYSAACLANGVENLDELRRLRHRVEALLAGVPGAEGPAQRRALVWLRDHGPATLREVARALGYARTDRKGNLYRVLRKMERLGLVAKELVKITPGRGGMSGRYSFVRRGKK